MRTNIYVDGFNLYYGCIKNTSFRWLDIPKLVGLLLPGIQVQRFRYFTANVSGKGDEQRPQRQQTYLRAIRAHSSAEVTLGTFKARQISRPLIAEFRGHQQNVWVTEAGGTSVWLPIDPAPPNGDQFVWVKNREEKRSDVNLAAYLIHDAHNGEFDTAAVISDDTDLVGALALVRSELGLKVAILNPQTWRLKENRKDGVDNTNLDLVNVADFYRSIRPGVLGASLLPDPVHDANGRAITKPQGW